MRPQERVCAALSNFIMAKPARNVKSDVGSIVWPPPFRESAPPLRPPGALERGLFPLSFAAPSFRRALFFGPAGAIGRVLDLPRGAVRDGPLDPR